MVDIYKFGYKLHDTYIMVEVIRTRGRMEGRGHMGRDKSFCRPNFELMVLRIQLERACSDVPVRMRSYYNA